jgi:hypothetical protein
VTCGANRLDAIDARVIGAVLPPIRRIDACRLRLRGVQAQRASGT